MEDWLPRGVFGKRPYRGIETVTYVVEGRIDHYDNQGHEGTILPGDVQWMTAGRGLCIMKSPPKAIVACNQRGNLQRMTLTHTMEMPPTTGLPAGPIAVFSNSYARLPEHFFARLAPTPVAKPHLIKFNDSLASELGVNTQGLDPDDWRRCLPATSHRRAQSRSRWSMPGISSAISFLSLATARNPPRRSLGPQRRAARCPVEGRGTNAVLAARRRPRRIGAGPARISR